MYQVGTGDFGDVFAKPARSACYKTVEIVKIGGSLRDIDPMAIWAKLRPCEQFQVNLRHFPENCSLVPPNIN